ncbi:hypothetical protein [Streptomyces cyslabdanicus]|uniref:hypothetical protein n=1 Tax=Streptomyces cyslabdanicus TaxID=1470456 RepID=UPI0040448C60
MHLTLRHCARGVAAGVLSAALVSAGSAAAFAATSPSPKQTRMHTTMPTRAASITARSSHDAIRAGESITLTGRTANLATGTKLTVERMENGKWTALRTTTEVKKGDTYTVSTKLATKGKQQLRVVHGDARSETVTVNVT